MAADYDLIVVGSGFGGSVCALRAAEAGLRVAVMERGRRMTDAAYEELAEGAIPLLHRVGRPGLIERHAVRGLDVLSGNAVGGTSHLYTGVTVSPPAEIFESSWPRGFAVDRFRACTERARAMIGASPTPVLLSRTAALERAARTMGGQAVRLSVAMTWPDRVSDLAGEPPRTGVRSGVVGWLRGGPSARKRTLDRTYLAAAEQRGAAVLSLHEATALERLDGAYRVWVRRWGEAEGEIVAWTAPRVVLAAGTLNTLRLLFHCRDVVRSLPNVSEALGRRFFTNGDFGALLLGPRGIPAADCGPPVTAWIDLWRSDRLFLMETGTSPALQEMVAAAMHAWNRLRRAEEDCGPYAWSIGVMGFDANPAQIALDRRGRLAFSRDARRSEAFGDRRLARLRELAAAVGATLLAPPCWIDRRRPVTIHPLGGASMADSSEGGVTNPFGEVFGGPGLFVADGSLLPVPTGCAPSLTIAALAEYVAEHMLTC